MNDVFGYPFVHGIADSSLGHSQYGDGFIQGEVEDGASCVWIERPLDEDHHLEEQLGEGVIAKGGGSEVGEFQVFAIWSGSNIPRTYHLAQGSVMHSESVETSFHSCADTWVLHCSRERI